MLRTTPESFLRGQFIEEFEPSTKALVTTLFEDASTRLTLPSIGRHEELMRSEYGPPVEGFISDTEPPPRDPTGLTPFVDPKTAQEKARSLGLDLSFDAPVRQGTLDILIARKQEERNRQSIIASAPGWGTFGLQMATEIFASFLDPVNVAAAFVPVVGEARFAQLAGRIGLTGARAVKGAAEGIVGAAAIEPITLAVAREEQADYDLYDSLINVVAGGAFGAGLHVGAGKIGDIIRGRQPDFSGIDAEAGRITTDRALATASPETRVAALRMAVLQIGNDRGVDVAPVLRADPSFARITDPRSSASVAAITAQIDGAPLPRLAPEDSPFKVAHEFTRDEYVALRQASIERVAGDRDIDGAVRRQIADVERELAFERGRGNVKNTERLEKLRDELRSSLDDTRVERATKGAGRAAKEHRKAVKAQIDAGMRIRADVIRDYPDLELGARARFLVDDVRQPDIGSFLKDEARRFGDPSSAALADPVAVASADETYRVAKALAGDEAEAQALADEAQELFDIVARTMDLDDKAKAELTKAATEFKKTADEQIKAFEAAGFCRLRTGT